MSHRATDVIDPFSASSRSCNRTMVSKFDARTKTMMKNDESENDCVGDGSF